MYETREEREQTREWTIVEGLDICSHVITPVSRRWRQNPIGSLVGCQRIVRTYIYSVVCTWETTIHRTAYSMIYGSRTVNSYRTNSSVLRSSHRGIYSLTYSFIHSLPHSLTALYHPILSYSSLSYPIPAARIPRLVSLRQVHKDRPHVPSYVREIMYWPRRLSNLSLLRLD